jgi:hypothetical protein
MIAMGYRLKKSFITALLVLVAPSFLSASESGLNFGMGLMRFDYAEYDDSNIFLDGETGVIPGVILKYKSDHGQQYSEWVGELYGKTINYDGQTQSGTPLTTKSDAVIFDTHYKMGFHLSRQQDHSAYFGLGFRYWYRNIRPGYDINGNPVAGLLEHYYWFYSVLGYATDFVINDTYNIGLDIRHTLMLNAKMDVDFLGYNNYDNTQVNLGNKSGLRIAIPVKLKTGKRSLTVSPYYEMIDIGRSNNVRVTSNGIPTTSVIYEPRSETRNVGIEVSWLW